MGERSLSKRAALYMGAQMAANVVGLTTGMVLARVFSKEEMGSYAQLMTIYGLFSSMLIMGLPQCLTYYYATSEERYKAATVYFVTGLLFLSGAVLGLATLVAAPYIASYFKNPALAPLVRDFFLFYAFTLGGSYIRRLAVVTNRYRFLMIWLPFDRLLMIVSFALPALLGYGLSGAVRVAVWVAGGKFLITTVYTLYIVPLTDFHWKKGLAGTMLAYSIPLGLSAAVTHVSGSIDKLVIGRFTSPEFFAVFSLGNMSIPFVGEIAESVMTVLVPVLAALYVESNSEQFAAIWRESVRKTAIFILAVFGFVEFFAVPIIVTLYGESYLDSVLYFRIRQFSMIWRITLFGAVLQSIHQTRRILYVMLVVVCIKPFVSVGAFKLAAAAFGIERAAVGPPIAALALNLSMSLYYIFFIKKQLGLSLRHAWPWSHHARILAAAVIAGAAASAVLLVPKTAIGSVVAALCGAVTALLRMVPVGFVRTTLAGFIETKLSSSASLVSLGQLLMGGIVFPPVYIVLLKAFRTLKEKDWALLKEMTVGRLKRK